MKLNGKVALVTGTSTNIGGGIAEGLAAEGAALVCVDARAENASDCARYIKSTGGRAAAVTCDVTDERQVIDAVAAAREAFGGIDILVNSAGISHIGTLETTSETDFDAVFRVNVKGMYNCMAASIGHMKARAGGVILNLASIAASAGLADRFAYSMSKGAVVAMTYSVARDFLDHNIRCNCISPARVHTPFVDGFLRRNYPGHEEEMFAKLAQSQPVGRMANPDEVAWLALFLCSDEAAFITGTDYPLDGGFLRLRG